MVAPKDVLRTPMGRVRGLGAAHRGTEHFIAQRITAIALIPLAAWFVWAVAAHTGADYGQARAFLGNPVNAALMLLFVLTGLYHMMVGMQVVIEDYVHDRTKIVLTLLNRFASAVVALACVIAILKLAL